ncbi:MAG: hypothetical protein H6918_08520 [Sphingomonadaceae bacterium]|nr:hypothetical protein [Sphingomonadaceae bacterium]
MKASLAFPLVAALALAACGSSNDDTDIIASDSGETAVAVGMSDEEDEGLGMVNMPRPVWLPIDFPLPADAHIFITVAKEQQTPPIFMLQARTRADGEKVADDFVAWAKSRGMKANRLDASSDKIHLASLETGNGLENANLQVHEQDDGIRVVILAASGEPWK